MQHSIIYEKNRNDINSCIFRSKKCKDNLISNINVTTIYGVFMSGFNKGKYAKCLGEIKELNPIKYDWILYNNVYDYTNILASRLMDEHYLSYQKTGNSIDNSNFIGIMSKNGINSFITELTCYFNSYISVPIYEKFSLDVIENILCDTQLKILFVDTKNLIKLLDLKKYHSLHKIVCFEKVDKDIVNKLKLLNIILIYYIDFCGEIICKEFVKPNSKFIATLNYTDDSSIETKGVLLTHANIIASMTAYIYHDIVLNKPDIHLNYLPLPNIFEKNIIFSILFGGGCIGFSRGDINLLFNEINALKPTVLSSIPYLFKNLYNTILLNLDKNIITRNLFDYIYKIAKYEYTIPNIFLERTIFKRIKEELGGNLRLIIIGYGSLEPKIIDFMKVCFDCCIIQQYGLTETSSCIALSNPYTKILKSHGIPVVSGEFCIRANSELSINIDKNNTFIHGELLYRGYNLFHNYFIGWTEEDDNLIKKNHVSKIRYIDKDGWFHSGDYVSIINNGSIFYIDKIENIVKIENGIYISYEQIEKVIELVPNIARCMVYYIPDKLKLIALIVLENRFAYPNIEIDILDHINSLCRNAGFKNYEIPTNIAIIDNSFTIDNGMLTSMYRLNRINILNKYNILIDKL